ncbi:MAG: hypothetical protein HYZ26_00420 [Chloroflexi bacterium]|nr:hypothetical protein [Chloroflexota bacterium]
MAVSRSWSFLNNRIFMPVILAVYRLVNPERNAFAAEQPTPAHRRPRSLAGRLWAIACYFNPASYANKIQNYRVFREHLGAQGIPLLAVELRFDDGADELSPDTDADALLQLRGRHVMWQKERLLNLALARLPADCDRIVWLDADVVFDRPDWAAETRRLLEDYAIVQPFSQTFNLKAGTRPPLRNAGAYPVGTLSGQRYYGMAYGVAHKGYDVLQDYRRAGLSGFAWAARREVFDGLGLYDRLITGGGDLVMSRAMFSGTEHLGLERFSPALAEDLAAWAARLYPRVRGSVGYLEGSLFHLWHGNPMNRAYGHRFQILVETEFDPCSDLEINPDGLFEWASQKPRLHEWCRHYFRHRDEERP